MSQVDIQVPVVWILCQFTLFCRSVHNQLESTLDGAGGLLENNNGASVPHFENSLEVTP